MRFKVWSFVLAAAFISAAIPALSQVGPSATSGGIPLIVGAGFSNYSTDWGPSPEWREDGGSLWAEWTLQHMPSAINGLGIGIVAHDITIDAPSQAPYLRYQTAGGGAVYHLLRYRNVRPYAKAMEQFGNIKFAPWPSPYREDTRNFFSVGGGVDLHAWRHLWVRADYEYQWWKGLFGSPNALTPSGFTIGPEIDLGGRAR